VSARPPLLRSILLVLAALACFAALDAIAKQLATRYPVPWLVWGRYTVHLLFMLLVLWPRYGGRLVRTCKPLANVMRGLMLTGVTGLNIAALQTMPLAEATALLFVAPVLVAVLAGPWLGEKVGWRKWLAVLLGFCGVLLIVRPGMGGPSAISATGVAFSLSAAACYAVYQVQTRQLSASEDALKLLFYTALVGTVSMSLAIPWFAASGLPTLSDALLIASLGLFGGGGHFMLINAYRHAPASTLSPLYYSQLLWATLIGYFAFGHWPDALGLLGIAVIAGSGVLVALPSR
jgi:drug/metabolite transporter (DMT)-like permease